MFVLSRRFHSVLCLTRLPRRVEVRGVPSSPRPRSAAWSGIIGMMSLRDISRARACRAAILHAGLFLPSFCLCRDVRCAAASVLPQGNHLHQRQGGGKDFNLLRKQISTGGGSIASTAGRGEWFFRGIPHISG